MTINSNPKPFRVCFSYAAYTKNLIEYLKSFNIPIEEGLTDVELASIESNLNFIFPPDLKSVLQEGLPVGPGFPNWRSTSIQELQILTSLPVLSLCNEISRNRFWLNSWGERPKDNDQAVNLGKGLLKNVPVLIPVYRNFYIAAVPLLAGNPVFYVHGVDVKLWSFDIAGFFHQVELRVGENVLRKPTLSKLLNVPAWAATEPRRIEFWTELVERGERLAASVGNPGWWSEDYFRECLEDVFWRLRDGGWKEEDVREMMMMEDERNDGINGTASVLDRECVMRHVEMWSKMLLRAGWSSEDVMESLGFSEDHQEESWFDCQQSVSSIWDNDNQDDFADTNEVISPVIEMMDKHRIKV